MREDFSTVKMKKGVRFIQAKNLGFSDLLNFLHKKKTFCRLSNLRNPFFFFFFFFLFLGMMVKTDFFLEIR